MQPCLPAGRTHEAAGRGAGRREGSEIRPNTPFGAETGSRDRLVERREAQPLSPKGARVPRQASQTCLDRRAERALAKPVRGLASPWRLPALHFPFFRGRKEGNGVTRAAKSNNRVGQALAFCVARSAAAAIVPALPHTPPQVTTGLSMAATTRFDVLGIGNAIVDVI